MAKIFVSHASADFELVDPFVDDVIRSGSEVHRRDLVYTSGADTRMPSGSNLNEYIRQNVGSADLVIAVVSPNYRMSPYCLAELGAAWVQAGVLFPIAIPGFSYGEMDGVLEGLITRSLDDDTTLNELHDAICAATGRPVMAKAWGKYREKWLVNLPAYMAKLPAVEIFTAAQEKSMQDKIDVLREALRDSEDQRRDLEENLQRLAAAKTAEEVRVALLPAGEMDCFEALRKKARDSLRKLDGIVAEAMWHDMYGQGMAWPSLYGDQSRANDAKHAFDEGFLRENSSEFLVPNPESVDVEEAREAVDALDAFLKEVTHDFYEWFRNKYRMPPGLSRQTVWNELIG